MYRIPTSKILSLGFSATFLGTSSKFPKNSQEFPVWTPKEGPDARYVPPLVLFEVDVWSNEYNFDARRILLIGINCDDCIIMNVLKLLVYLPHLSRDYQTHDQNKGITNCVFSRRRNKLGLSCTKLS